VTTAKGRGRNKCTSDKTDRRIVRLALKNRKSTANEINSILQDSNVKISDRTVRRRLVSAGLKARIPRKRPYLNEKQRKKRLTWAKAHINWTTDEWKKVLWSDETKISIFGSDGVRYVRRRPGEDNIPECTTATMKHPVSVMIWGCMAMTGVGRSQVVDGTINAVKYISSILQPKMLPSARDLFGPGSDYIFQQDSAPCHVARKCMKWFADNNVEVLDWPGNSPDLNPLRTCGRD